MPVKDRPGSGIPIVSVFFISLTIKMVTQQFEQCIRHQNYDTLLTL